jgi:hypothetical protein
MLILSPFLLIIMKEFIVNNDIKEFWDKKFNKACFNCLNQIENFEVKVNHSIKRKNNKIIYVNYHGHRIYKHSKEKNELHTYYKFLIDCMGNCTILYNNSLGSYRIGKVIEFSSNKMVVEYFGMSQTVGKEIKIKDTYIKKANGTIELESYYINEDGSNNYGYTALIECI